MRRAFLAVLIVALTQPIVAQTASPTRTPTPVSATKGPDDETFYAIGVSVAKSLSGLDLSPSEAASVMKGISDGFAGKAAGLDVETARAQANNIVKARAPGLLAKEKARGKAYSDEAAKAQDAVVWPSGLILTTVRQGTGESPGASDTVKVRYRGTLVDGTEFDSSARGHGIATFPVNNVIRCWTEGLQKMSVGGQARFVCPADIAYGDRGAPPVIPGGATLVFEIELVEIVKATPSNALTPSRTPSP